MMLTTLDTQLRRHRRQVRWLLAVVAVVAAALTAHSALISSDMGDHKMDAVAICLVAGGCVAVIGVAAFAVRRLLQRPTWVIPAPVAPALPFIPASAGFLVRAGPPPLLQVLRL
jgi:hypothetical protein